MKLLPTLALFATVLAASPSTVAAETRSNFVDIDGVRMHYLEAGDRCQGSCRLDHAVSREIICGSEAATNSGRSGLSVTAPMTLQFRVCPLQRPGFAALAAW